MTKTALLIGVSDYGFGFNPLPRAQKDVQAMRQTLQHPEIGSFTEVRTLVNPDRQVIEEAIEALFSGRQRDDLVLLYFSGHAIKDSDGKLYLATSITRRSEREQLVKSSVVPASFVRETMNDSRSQQQVMILDCCLSEALTVSVSTVDTKIGVRVGISATDANMSQASVEEKAFSEEKVFPQDTGWLGKDGNSLDISNQLGGGGRVILTSSTSTPFSFEHQVSGLSVYTHYLVEGMETGVSDLDNNGAISIEELHEYASRKAQTATPVMQPRIYRVENHHQIILTEVDLDDPGRRYRKEVERYANRGEISVMNRSILGVLRDSLGLRPEEAAAIEAGVLEPYREYQRKLQRYVRGFVEAIYHESSIGKDTRNGLKSFQQILGLTDVDVAPIEAQVTQQRESFSPPDRVVESTEVQTTTTVSHGTVKPVELRPEAVAANSATPALTGATTWDKGAYPASIAPRTWLLVGIGVAAILAWTGVIHKFSSRPTAPPASLLKPRPTSVPEPLPSSVPPLTAPASESPLFSAPSPLPTPLSGSPSPSTNPVLPVPMPTSSAQSQPEAPIQSKSKAPAAQPKPRSAVSKPLPSKPNVPAQPSSASKPRVAVPDPPIVSPEPPPTSAPKAPSSFPEPPTSWSEPPPTSAPGQDF